MSPESKDTWDCEYCKAKRLDSVRNCGNKFSPTSIIINKDTLLTECPMSLGYSSECSTVYSILKSTLLNEMGIASTPSVLLNELNILFIYKNTIQNAEGACKKS